MGSTRRGRKDAFSQDWSMTRPAATCLGCWLGLTSLSKLDKSHVLRLTRGQGEGIFPLSNAIADALLSKARRKTGVTCVAECSCDR